MSWYDTFINPRTCGAAWIGVSICAMQHTNLNVGVVMYSSSLFDAVGVSVAAGNILLMSFNLFGNFPAFCLLANFGRKFNQMLSMLILDTLLFMMGYCHLQGYPKTLLGTSAAFLFFA